MDPENYAIRNLELDTDECEELSLNGFIALKTANMLLQPYQVTNEDIFANDWLRY